MDLADIKRKALAGREFQAVIGALTFTLRLPTDNERDVELARVRLHEGVDDPAVMVRLMRALVERAVVAWVGVTCEHLAAGAGPEPVELSRETVGLFLDANPTEAKELRDMFVAERVARNDKQGIAAKN